MLPSVFTSLYHQVASWPLQAHFLSYSFSVLEALGQHGGGKNLEPLCNEQPPSAYHCYVSSGEEKDCKTALRLLLQKEQ